MKAGFSKNKLAAMSGVSRQYIAAIEEGKREGRTSANVLIRLANALQIPPEPFLEAIGLEPLPNLPEYNRLAAPVKVPIYTDFPFHAGSPTLPVEYVHRATVKPAPKHIEGYIVHGNCLEPVVQDKDIIIVDREGQIDNGDIVACLIEEELHIARLRKVAGELWLENNYKKYRFQDCHVAAPVIEIIRRLK